jgi:hypothetical protein
MSVYFVARATPTHGPMTTMFSDLELAKQFKRGFVEQNGYAERDITISGVDEEREPFEF